MDDQWTSVQVHAVRGRHAEQRVVHVRFARVGVRIRIPEGPAPHSHPLTTLLPDHDLHEELIPRLLQVPQPVSYLVALRLVGGTLVVNEWRWWW